VEIAVADAQGVVRDLLGKIVQVAVQRGARRHSLTVADEPQLEAGELPAQARRVEGPVPGGQACHRLRRQYLEGRQQRRRQPRPLGLGRRAK
jgi:hypothetical protein